MSPGQKLRDSLNMLRFILPQPSGQKCGCCRRDIGPLCMVARSGAARQKGLVATSGPLILGSSSTTRRQSSWRWRAFIAVFLAVIGLAAYFEAYLVVIGLAVGDGDPGECDGRDATAAAAGDADCSGEPAASRAADEL